MSRTSQLLLLLVSVASVGWTSLASAQRGITEPPTLCLDPECVALDAADFGSPNPAGRRHRREVGMIDWESINHGASSVFFRFFSNVAPNSSGIQRANLHENPMTEVEAHLGDSRLSVVMLGNGNNYQMTPIRFFREYNGVVALRYGLLSPSPFQISVTAAPLYASYVQVSRYMGIYDDEVLPSALVLGGAAGVDVTYGTDAMLLEAHAYVMPGADVATGAAGVRQIQMAQATFSLNHIFQVSEIIPLDFALQVMHVDRGDAQESVYSYAPQGFRSPRETREVWQAMAWFTLRRG